MTPDQELPEREQRVVDLLIQAGAETRAPDSLRAEVGKLQQRRRGSRPGSVPRRGTLPRLRGGLDGVGRLRAGLAGATAAVAAIAAVLVVALSGGGAATLSLSQVAALSGRGPAGPAPGPLPAASTTLLTAAVGDLHFPNWQSRGGWRSNGERTDTIAGRSVTTVYYTHAGTRLAYSIVASPALPDTGTGYDRYVVMHRGQQVTVVWTDRDHTCTLTGAGVSADSLWNLAKTTLD